MEPHLKPDTPANDGRAATRRGRPTTEDNRHVIEDIRRAVISCLERKSPHQLTVTEIAAAAGVRPAMVYYYFGGIEGLLTDILEQDLKDILDATRSLQDAIRLDQVANPLRAMIAMFATAYNQRPALMRILISELLRDESQIREVFLKKWPAFGKQMMDDVIAQLSASGYYRSDIDVDGIGMMIRSVIFFPLIIKPYIEREGHSIEQYLDDKWIGFISGVFECYLLGPCTGREHDGRTQNR